MKQVVRYSPEGYYEFLFENEVVYDFECDGDRSALNWVDHMAQKNWVTKDHLRQFIQLFIANARGNP